MSTAPGRIRNDDADRPRRILRRWGPRTPSTAAQEMNCKSEPVSTTSYGLRVAPYGHRTILCGNPFASRSRLKAHACFTAFLRFLYVTSALLSGIPGGSRRSDPSRPIRPAVAFPRPAPRSSPYRGARLPARLAAPLGQQVVVDNRSGASGTLGSEMVAKATPDGYTLLIAVAEPPPGRAERLPQAGLRSSQRLRPHRAAFVLSRT